MRTAASAAATTSSARGRRGSASAAASHGKAVAAGYDASNGLTRLRMLFERSIVHRLLDFETNGFLARQGRDGLVNVGWHGGECVAC